MQYVIHLMLCAALALGVSLAHASDSSKPVVRVAMMMFPGFSEVDDQGRIVGKTVRLTRRLLEHAGYRADIRIMPAARIWRGLEGGQVHLWPGVLDKPGLDAHTLVTERDLGRVGINLYYRPGEPAPMVPSGLSGKRLILITNYTYVESLVRQVLDPGRGATRVSSSSHLGALQMLLKGRGDYLLDYRVQVEAAARELGLDPLPSIPVAEQPMRFLISNKSGFASSLRADLDRAYDQLVTAGEDLEVTHQ